jgi:hypothetical protein
MFVALLETDKSRIEAANAIRGLKHICPRCLAAVILHRGRIKRPHFKHDRDAACPYGQGESWQHEQAKADILAGIRARGLAAEPELEVLSVEGDRRADVIAFAPSIGSKESGRRAFEVQYSPISFDDLQQRTFAYMAAGVPMLWIPVIDEGKFGTIYQVHGTKLVCVSGYSAPSWIQDIAKLHQRLWIYVPQSRAFWRAWLLPHWCYKNPTDSYYDSSGNQHGGSNGYWFQAAKKRDLYMEGPYLFDSLKISTGNHINNRLVSPNGQKCWLVELLPEGKETALSPPIEQRLTPHLHNGRDTGSYTYVDWLTAEGNEQKAIFTRLDSTPKIEPNV